MDIALEIRNGQHQKLLYHTDTHTHTHDFMRKIQTACLTKLDSSLVNLNHQVIC